MRPSSLRDFDVLFCVGHSLLSNTIRTATKSDFSHVAHFRVINGKYFVVDAQANGLTVRTWDEWIEQFNYKFVAMREDDVPTNEYAEREFNLLGTRYDYRRLLLSQPRKIIIDKLNSIFKRNKDDWNENKDETKRLYCSEHIATVRNFAEKQLTPQQVFTECMLRGYKMIKDE